MKTGDGSRNPLQTPPGLPWEPGTEAPWTLGRGLKWELNVVTGLIVAGGLAVLIFLDFVFMRQAFYKERAEHLREVAALMLEMTREAVSVSEIQRVVSVVGSRLGGPRFPAHRIMVSDPEGRILAGFPETLVGGRLSESEGDVSTRFLRLKRAFPLPEDRGTGSLIISLSLDTVRQQLLYNVGYHLAALLLVLVLVFVSLRRTLSTRVIQPIESLVEAMGRMERGTWRLSLDVPSRNEIGWLTASFLRMGERLEETVRQLVRAEKVASAAMVAIRVKRELAEPIRSLKNGLKYFEVAWVKKAPGDRSVVRQLLEDVARMEAAVHRLAQIEEAALGEKRASHPAEGSVHG